MKTIFDIETGPDPEAICPPFNPDDVKCGNIKDPEKIRAKLAEAEANHEKQWLENAALSPFSGRVLCVGVKVGKEIGFSVLEGSEKVILQNFWDLVNKVETFWYGFNIFQFDLPFLIKRSWHLGVSAPIEKVRHGSYWSDKFIDVREYFNFYVRNEPGTQ